MDSYVLVETAKVAALAPDTSKITVITKVLRTYESQSRADEDLDLLKLVLPEMRFEVQEIAYIDR